MAKKFTEKLKIAVVRVLMDKPEDMTKKAFAARNGIHPDTLRTWEKKYRPQLENPVENPVEVSVRKNMKKFVVYTVDELGNVEYVAPNFERKKKMTDDKNEAYIFKYEKTVSKYVDMLDNVNPHKTCMSEKLI